MNKISQGSETDRLSQVRCLMEEALLNCVKSLNDQVDVETNVSDYVKTLKDIAFVYEVLDGGFS